MSYGLTQYFALVIIGHPPSPPKPTILPIKRTQAGAHQKRFSPAAPTNLIIRVIYAYVFVWVVGGMAVPSLNCAGDYAPRAKVRTKKKHAQYK